MRAFVSKTFVPLLQDVPLPAVILRHCWEADDLLPPRRVIGVYPPRPQGLPVAM